MFVVHFQTSTIILKFHSYSKHKIHKLKQNISTLSLAELIKPPSRATNQEQSTTPTLQPPPPLPHPANGLEHNKYLIKNEDYPIKGKPKVNVQTTRLTPTKLTQTPRRRRNEAESVIKSLSIHKCASGKSLFRLAISSTLWRLTPVMFALTFFGEIYQQDLEAFLFQIWFYRLQDQQTNTFWLGNKNKLNTNCVSGRLSIDKTSLVSGKDGGWSRVD